MAFTGLLPVPFQKHISPVLSGLVLIPPIAYALEYNDA